MSKKQKDNTEEGHIYLPADVVEEMRGLSNVRAGLDDHMAGINRFMSKEYGRLATARDKWWRTVLADNDLEWSEHWDCHIEEGYIHERQPKSTGQESGK